MVSKGKVDYNNLFDMKPIWTVPETARFLSDYWVGEITEADVLRLALEGKLKLSVNILVKKPGRTILRFSAIEESKGSGRCLRYKWYL